MVTFGKKFDRADAENSGDSSTSTASIWNFQSGTTTVRFLEELDDWTPYWEHYDQGKKKFYPCPGRNNNCPGCAEDLRASKKYLVNALVTGSTNSKVKAGYVNLYKVPASLMEKVIRRHDRYATLLDRDYEVIRSGTGLDTSYDLENSDEGRSPVDMEKHQSSMTEHEEALQSAWKAAYPTEDLPVDDEPVAAAPAVKKARPKTAEQVEDEARAKKQEESDFAKAKAGKTDPPSEPAVQSESADDTGETVLTEESIRAMSVEELINLYNLAGLETDNAKSGSAEDLAEYLIDTLGD